MATMPLARARRPEPARTPAAIATRAATSVVASMSRRLAAT